MRSRDLVTIKTIARQLVMSNGATVRAHIAAILKDEEFSLDTPRMKLARQTASNLLEIIGASSPAFDNFAVSLEKKLQPENKTFGSRARKGMWTSFHAMRSNELAVLWSELFAALRMEVKFTIDPLFQQYVNDRVFQDILQSKISPVNVSTEPPELSVNELNAMRYVAGYVPF